MKGYCISDGNLHQRYLCSYVPVEKEEERHDRRNYTKDYSYIHKISRNHKFSAGEKPPGVKFIYVAMHYCIHRREGRILVKKNLEIDQFLNAIYNGILAINTEGKVILLNKSAARFIGVSMEEALGQKVDKLVPNTGLLEILETEESRPTQKVQIKNRTVISNRTPIYNRDGRLIGAIGVFQDISDLEKVTEELREERKIKEELDAIIESSYDGMWITDGRGYTLHLNSAYEKLSGLKREEVVGRHMQELVDEGYFSESVTLRVLEEKKPITIMHNIFKKKDKKVLITGNPIFNENQEIVRVVTNVRDITELMALKEESELKDKLAAQYKEELDRLRSGQLKLENFVVHSSQMQHVFDLAIRVGQVNSTVLITGESGVGKEGIANAIVQASERKDEPFIKVNCGAIPENLLESELFGYEGGAFTGADRKGKLGMFELANQVTIFLDEVAELPLRLQVKLLRVFQDGQIMRIGGVKPVSLDVRVLAATNKDLGKLVQQGNFREDLYYRLNVVPITIPPLRERKEDVPALINFFMSKFNREHNLYKRISGDAIDCLIDYPWPGNVRELQNLIERLVVLSREPVITLEQVPQHFKSTLNRPEEELRLNMGKNVTLKEAVTRLEEKLITAAMDTHKTTRKAAQALGVDQSTVVRKLQKIQLDQD